MKRILILILLLLAACTTYPDGWDTVGSCHTFTYWLPQVEYTPGPRPPLKTITSGGDCLNKATLLHALLDTDDIDSTAIIGPVA